MHPKTQSRRSMEQWIAVVILTVDGKPCCYFGKPLHMGPRKRRLNRDGNSEHIVSCHMAKSSGTFT